MSDYTENCPECNDGDCLLFRNGQWVIDQLNVYVPVKFCPSCGVKLEIPKKLVSEFKFSSNIEAKLYFQFALDECIENLGVRGPEMCTWTVWMPLDPNTAADPLGRTGLIKWELNKQGERHERQRIND